MTESLTLNTEEPLNGNGHTSPLVHALRDLLSLPKKEGKAQIRKLSVVEQLELFDLVRASLSLANGADEAEAARDPYWQEVAADLKWTAEQHNAGAFDDVHGQYVAVANKQRLGSGPYPDVLTDEVAAKTGLSPERIIIHYVFDGSWSR